MENNNRRNFLKTGALAGAALLSTSTFSSVAGDNDIAGKSNSNALQNSKRRTLGSGKHAIEVPALGLGCMGMSYHRSFIPDRKAMINLIRKSADLGVNFFDTAEAYGPFTNEELVGEALQPIRKNVIVVTKFGF